MKKILVAAMLVMACANGAWANGYDVTSDGYKELIADADKLASSIANVCGSMATMPSKHQESACFSFSETASNRVNGQIPGSSIKCGCSGKPTGMALRQNQQTNIVSGQVQSFEQKSVNGVIMFVQPGGLVRISNQDSDFVSFMVNTDHPEMSIFNSAKLQFAANDGVATAGQHGGVSIADNKIVQMLNIQASHLTDSGNMFALANKLLVNSTYRNEFRELMIKEFSNKASKNPVLSERDAKIQQLQIELEALKNGDGAVTASDNEPTAPAKVPAKKTKKAKRPVAE